MLFSVLRKQIYFDTPPKDEDSCWNVYGKTDTIVTVHITMYQVLDPTASYNSLPPNGINGTNLPNFRQKELNDTNLQSDL
ncbi:hypothetical protein DPX16_12202 [Anabarilius grahami]|uniref:Uncharacterized protein n=1 Tax=Anabarilius grahami TaxID=495550 RepID=A0A3N0YQV2_ANAGA|nr:hypothetical protein DPX16_12202 [Anabarilius grahami]